MDIKLKRTKTVALLSLSCRLSFLIQKRSNFIFSRNAVFASASIAFHKVCSIRDFLVLAETHSRFAIDLIQRQSIVIRRFFWSAQDFQPLVRLSISIIRRVAF